MPHAWAVFTTRSFAFLNSASSVTSTLAALAACTIFFRFGTRMEGSNSEQTTP